MLNSNLFSKMGLFLYIFIYLIFPNLAISENTKIDIREDLENALNNRDLRYINENFNDEESVIIKENLLKIIQDFPDAKWQIKRLNTQNEEESIFAIKVLGKKIVDEEIFILESNFKYFFINRNGEIKNSLIKDLLTTIRNDQNNIDIIFSIPDKVLTGTKYDIDIILNEPLGEVIIAGGIKPHQYESYLQPEISIKPLASGGIFKMTRAPSKPGIQIWSGIIAHPKGMISFTKTVDILEKI